VALVTALAAVIAGMALLGAALLAALRASSPSSFGSPAALALVGRLPPFLPASGAGLLVSLGPAVMSLIILNASILLRWSVQKIFFWEGSHCMCVA
jgi:hypothetical protein